MNVSRAVQAHPLRAELAEQLALEIGGEVVYDPEPDGLRSPWRTYRTALERTPADATHRLVIQEDAIVCRGFTAAVTAAARAQPDRLLVLFVGGTPVEHVRAVRGACTLGLPWAELDNRRWCPAVAVVWPVPLIEPLLRFVDAKKWPPAFRADDEIIGRFLRDADHRPLATVPSLVDHPDDVPSLLIAQRSRHGLDPGRVAYCWIGDCDPASIDWSSGP